MFDDMVDISAQMVLRWDRMGEDHAIECSDDFTRLAFDTIGLCSFGYRFNEFYTDEAHPFAKQMADVLKMSGRRANRTDIENKLHRWEEQSRQDNVAKMHELVNQVVADRKAQPKPDAKDLLNTMLFAADRETGQTLTEQNVANNMVTFLVSVLSFEIHFRQLLTFSIAPAMKQQVRLFHLCGTTSSRTPRNSTRRNKRSTKSLATASSPSTCSQSCNILTLVSKRLYA